MIPSTAAGLLALLGCIAPGLVFQLRRERHQPRADESALREASRIALTSLLFTAVSLAFLVWLNGWWSALPNIQLWLGSGRAYLRENYLSVSLFLTLEVVIACLLAFISERLTRGAVQGELSPDSVWWKVFRGDFPTSAERVSLWVTTENGTQFRGALRHYTPETALANREMALGGSAFETVGTRCRPVEGLGGLSRVRRHRFGRVGHPPRGGSVPPFRRDYRARVPTEISRRAASAVISAVKVLVLVPTTGTVEMILCFQLHERPSPSTAPRSLRSRGERQQSSKDDDPTRRSPPGKNRSCSGLHEVALSMTPIPPRRLLSVGPSEEIRNVHSGDPGQDIQPRGVVCRLQSVVLEVGWLDRLLGGTAGVTEDGRFIAVVRFESEEDARRNRDRPEQDRWWSETAKLFDGSPHFVTALT